MANQRDTNKRILGVYVTREDHAKLTKLAARKKITVAEMMRLTLAKMVENVDLAPQEKAKIKEERVHASKRQSQLLAKRRSLQARLDAYRKKL